MRGRILRACLLAVVATTSHAAAPERGSVDVGGRSAFEAATRSGGDRGQRFCIRVMYNTVPLPLYGEIYIEGNATACDSTERVEVDRIVLRYKYRGEPLRSRECAKTYQCDVSERFYRGMRDLDCAAVTAIAGDWSATAATAPGCL